MAGRPRTRAKQAAAIAAGEPVPVHPASRDPDAAAERAAERVRLQKLIRAPSGFTTTRCTHTFKSGKRKGERCKSASVWGLDVCVRHGGLKPDRLDDLRDRMSAMLAALDPRKLIIRANQVIDAHIGMIMDDAGKLLPPDEWPREVLPAIKSVKILNYNADPSDGKIEQVVEVTFVDQSRYQELLMRHAGQLDAKVQLSGTVKQEPTVGRELVDALREGLERAAAAPTQTLTCPHCHREIDPAGSGSAVKPPASTGATARAERGHRQRAPTAPTRARRHRLIREAGPD